MPESRTSTTPHPPAPAPGVGRALRWAWVSLFFLPVSFIGAMVLGDWLMTSQGYQSDADDIELGAVLKAGFPALLVLIAPALAAACFGLRARKLGHPGWLAPVLTAGVIAAAALALNLLQLVVVLVQRA